MSQFVQLVLEGEDAYRMMLHASEAAAATEPPLVDVRYTRAPAGRR